MKPELISSKAVSLSPWVTLHERSYVFDEGAPPETFHFLRPHDYVNVLAITADGKVPLVRQFRPAIERFTIELPGGLIEDGDEIAQRALTELTEETGFRATEDPIPLPPLFPEVGRLENKLHGLVVLNAAYPEADWAREAGVEPLLLSLDEFAALFRSGGIPNCSNVAVVALAMSLGHVAMPA